MIRPIVATLVLAALTAGPAAEIRAQAPTTPTAETATDTPPATTGLKPIPSPKLLAAEVEHVTRFDQLIAPVRGHQPSPEDLTRVRDAFRAIGGSRLTEAAQLRDQITDPAARKLAEWGLLRSGVGTARDIRVFRDQNPVWPDRGLLAQRAEESLFTAGGSAREIKAAFEGGQPKTGIGWAALASALLAEGDQAGATQAAAKAWRDNDIPVSLESGFLERFKVLLAEADHKWRFDRLIAEDSRWAGERGDRAARMRRVVALLSEPERKKAEARLAVYLRSSAADKLIAALPADAATAPKPDWGLVLSLAQWHRRAGRHAESSKLLIGSSTDAAMVANLDGWWEERRAAAYEALRLGQAETAYALVKTPGPLGANAHKDAAFMAGWLSLSRLRNFKQAEAHFAEFETAADGPLSRAKAGYWHGRALELMSLKAEAESAFTRGAKGYDTFYGLLSRQRVAPGKPLLEVGPPATPTPEQVVRFNNLDAIKAIVIAKKAGLGPETMRALLGGMRDQFDTEAETAMLAHLTEALGDTQMALRIGKAAVARGMNLIYYAYPIHPMPAYTPLRAPPEPAFLLAIARQESEFNTTTFSGAGARGILQVMPVTAKHVCIDYKVKCDISRLMTDPAYNTMMGSAYIADRMREFQGAYVLTLAGYNAGPGRARQWMRENGDPRDGKIDPLDWIHSIPIEETREYVQKVMANIQVYRARLGEDVSAERLGRDLRRTADFTGTAPQRSRAAGAAPLALPATSN